MRPTHPTRSPHTLTLLTLLAVATPTTAAADRSGTHDGFFLRLSTGIGGGRVKGDNDSSGTFSGGLAQGDLAIGGIVTDNLAIHASSFAMTMFNPDYEASEGGATVTFNDLDVTMRVAGLGVGLTYYFMPSNFYLSGALGFTVANVEARYSFLGVTRTRTWESEAGFGLQLQGGKEWWVSDNWGLGVAGQFIYASVPVNIDNTEDTFSGIGLGVLFSATYN